MRQFHSYRGFYLENLPYGHLSRAKEERIILIQIEFAIFKIFNTKKKGRKSFSNSLIFLL